MKRDAKVQTDEVQIFKVLRSLSDLSRFSQASVMHSPWTVSNKRQSPECWIVPEIVAFSTARKPLVEALKSPFQDSFLETDLVRGFPDTQRVFHRAVHRLWTAPLPPSPGLLAAASQVYQLLTTAVAQRRRYFTVYWELDHKAPLPLLTLLILYLILTDQVLAPPLVQSIAEYVVLYALEKTVQAHKTHLDVANNPSPGDAADLDAIDWPLVDRLDLVLGPGDGSLVGIRHFMEAFEVAVSQWRRAADTLKRLPLL